jgi:hypothetical protein
LRWTVSGSAECGIESRKSRPEEPPTDRPGRTLRWFIRLCRTLHRADESLRRVQKPASADWSEDRSPANHLQNLAHNRRASAKAGLKLPSVCCARSAHHRGFESRQAITSLKVSPRPTSLDPIAKGRTLSPRTDTDISQPSNCACIASQQWSSLKSSAESQMPARAARTA